MLKRERQLKLYSWEVGDEKYLCASIISQSHVGRACPPHPFNFWFAPRRLRLPFRRAWGSWLVVWTSFGAAERHYCSDLLCFLGTRIFQGNEEIKRMRRLSFTERSRVLEITRSFGFSG